MAETPSLTARLAAFFEARPNIWHDGKTLATIAGGYGWRTRVSELRRFPYNFNIENRQRRLRRADGSTFVVSEYRHVRNAEGRHGVSEGTVSAW